MSDNEMKNKIKNTFNEASSGYDLSELSFFKKSSQFLIDLVKINGNEKILDVCTGTGHAVHYASKKITNGFITGIDISEKMIEIAKNKEKKNSKINLICTDLEEFYPNLKFDLITCAFGIFFFPDMKKAIQKMKSLLNKNGRIILSSFEAPFMEPQRGIFMENLKKYNVPIRPSLWSDINTEKKFRSFLEQNDFKKVGIFKNDCSYFIEDSSKWWNIIIYSNMRSNLNSLTDKELKKFKEEHLKEIDKLKIPNKGIWLEVKVMYAICYI